MKKVLYYDPYTTGHHPEYLAHPISYYSVSRDSHGVIVCAASLGEQLKQFADECGSSIEFELIDPTFQESIADAGSLWSQGQADAACFTHYVKNLRPDLAIALCANPLQPFLNWGYLRKCRACIRGILFDPLPLPQRMSKEARNLKWRVTLIRKSLQVKWFSMSQAIDKMFVLNDSCVAAQCQRFAVSEGCSFEAIPDPLPLHLRTHTSKNAISADRDICRMLFIGSINRRKGLLETLDALEALTDGMASQVVLRVVGRFLDDDLRGVSVARIERMKSAGFRIELCEGWITDEQFGQEMRDCDLVLVPYVGFHGSSGVLGHASFLGKPLLATCDGLVGELVQTYELGRVVQTRNAVKYAEALKEYITGGWDYRKQQSEYARAMSSEVFMNQLLK